MDGFHEEPNLFLALLLGYLAGREQFGRVMLSKSQNSLFVVLLRSSGVKKRLAWKGDRFMAGSNAICHDATAGLCRLPSPVSPPFIIGRYNISL